LLPYLPDLKEFTHLAHTFHKETNEQPIQSYAS